MFPPEPGGLLNTLIGSTEKNFIVSEGFPPERASRGSSCAPFLLHRGCPFGERLAFGAILPGEVAAHLRVREGDSLSVTEISDGIRRIRSGRSPRYG